MTGRIASFAKAFRRRARQQEAERLAFVRRPIVEGLEPAKLYDPPWPMDPPTVRRRIPDERLDLFEAKRLNEALERAGYRRTWRDDLDDYVSDLCFATAHHATTAIIASFVTLALIIAPFALGWME
jgi:hypothetical protein